jgi:hypothetical protein
VNLIFHLWLKRISFASIFAASRLNYGLKKRSAFAAHFGQRGLFDLADALFGEAHPRADLFVGGWPAFAGEAVVGGDDIALATLEAGH